MQKPRSDCSAVVIPGPMPSRGMLLMTGYRTQPRGFDSPPDDRRSGRTRPNGPAHAARVRHQAEELQDATATLSLVAGLGLAGIALMVVIDLLIARTL